MTKHTHALCKYDDTRKTKRIQSKRKVITTFNILKTESRIFLEAVVRSCRHLSQNTCHQSTLSRKNFSTNLTEYFYNEFVKLNQHSVAWSNTLHPWLPPICFTNIIAFFVLPLYFKYWPFRSTSNIYWKQQNLEKCWSFNLPNFQF